VKENHVSIDERALRELVVESEDLHADAMRDGKAVQADLTELGASRQGRPVDLDRIRQYQTDRRRIMRNGGFGMGALAARGLLGTAFGASVMSILNPSAAGAQEGGADVDVQILQTASSLEVLAVATYDAALGLPFIANGNPVVKEFAMTTMDQHAQHRDAFQTQTETLGGTAQDQPNPPNQQVVDDALPTLRQPIDVVMLAATLEEVATDTYLANLSLLEDVETRSLMGSVMGVECQHLATLRAVGALLEGGAPELIAIPTMVNQLPAAAGSVAFPQPFEEPNLAEPPESGAVA
jgi:hypothetical protein